MIISASRRTDIPAFYAPWFMNRVAQGFVLNRNPFNPKQISRISLLPEDVTALVFWTRNAAPLQPCLDELDARGYRYYFQYTVTGYPRSLETATPTLARALENFSALSERLGPQRVIWRYDPVLLCNQVDLQGHRQGFETIARALAGKTRRNLQQVKGLIATDILDQPDEAYALCDFFLTTAARYGIELRTCAEPVAAVHSNMQAGKCVDDALLNRLYGLELAAKKDPGQREHCGCIKSVDIGMYNTCLHGCTYCYATYSPTRAADNRRRHDPADPFLVPNP